MAESTQIVQKLWNYCNVLRDDLSACDAQADGMSYLLARCAQASGDYPSVRLRAGVEQLTYLLFLKMADERTKPPYLPASGLTASGLAQAGAGNQPPSIIPDKYSWPSLLKKDGDDLVTAVGTNLTRADRLRQSILRQAFSGQLVKQGSKNTHSTVPT
jgi:type I restriction enzyme M protein